MKFSVAALATLAFAGLSAAAAVPQQLVQRNPVVDLADVGARIASIILEGKAADDEVRGRFAQNMIDGFRREYGDASNIVVIHTGHDYTWNGDQGNAWDHWHYELDVSIGGTIGYEMYVSKVGGYLKRTGDGGSQNGREEDGSRLTFADTGDL
ncbi:hypothetical protein V8E36_007054 [Tilletia maclaganii]